MAGRKSTPTATTTKMTMMRTTKDKLRQLRPRLRTPRRRVLRRRRPQTSTTATVTTAVTATATANDDICECDNDHDDDDDDDRCYDDGDATTQLLLLVLDPRRARHALEAVRVAVAAVPPAGVLLAPRHGPPEGALVVHLDLPSTLQHWKQRRKRCHHDNSITIAIAICGGGHLSALQCVSPISHSLSWWRPFLSAPIVAICLTSKPCFVSTLSRMSAKATDLCLPDRHHSMKIEGGQVRPAACALSRTSRATSTIWQGKDVHIPTYTHTCTHTHTHTRIRTHTQAHTYVIAYIHTFVKYKPTHINTYMCAHAHTRMNSPFSMDTIHKHIHTPRHPYIDIHMNINTDTYTRPPHDAAATGAGRRRRTSRNVCCPRPGPSWVWVLSFP